tara:strand:- start:1185 stop:2384 length:1200 start_codon:yes stop_codon:yes gene_type:complete
MATVFKNLTNDDITTTRTLLHESIPITGSIVSGTYNGNGNIALGSEENIKTYSHGMFESVYDYPYLSSSANHIFDITLGYSTGSALSSSSNTQNTKKINLYQQLAQVMVGFTTGSSEIRPFDENGDLTEGTKIKECFFLNFSRLLQKDEIKKGSFNLELGVDAVWDQDTYGGSVFNDRILITDASGSSGYKVNSPAGEYGILYATSSANRGATAAPKTLWSGSAYADDGTGWKIPVGLLYYQTGIAVISGSVFNRNVGTSPVGILDAVATSASFLGPEFGVSALQGSGFNAITASSIDTICNGIRNRIYNISFNNTTELNSTIYFCRANHNDFNFSANPTYLSSSKIRVKNISTDAPVSYITSVGLYSPDNELLAVAKLSEPLKKSPETELTLRVRLDY